MEKRELEFVQEHFRNEPLICKDDLIDFIVSSFPDKNRSYSRFYLADLLHSGIAYPVEKDLWKSADGKKFFSAEGETDPNIKRILEGILPPSVFSLWNISSLNRLLSLQSFHDIHIVSSYAASEEDVFYALVHESYEPLPLRSLRRYRNVPLSPRAVLVTGMNEDAPLFRKAQKLYSHSSKSLVAFPRIEKILIDCYCGDVPLDPSQVKEIFVRGVQDYFVNFSILERYARSRGKKEEILSLLKDLSLKGDENDHL
jgi:hypothetical protein